MRIKIIFVFCAALVFTFLAQGILPGSKAGAGNQDVRKNGNHGYSLFSNQGIFKNQGIAKDNSAPPQPEYVKGQLIVKFKEGSRTAQSLKTSIGQDSFKSIHKVKEIRPIFKKPRKEKKFENRLKRAVSPEKAPNLENIYLLDLGERSDVKAAIEKFKSDADIEYVEPNYIYKTQMIPNDPFYSSSNSWSQGYDDLWGLKKMQMEGAWDIALSGPLAPVTVAVIDTGVDYYHVDLAANIWVNSGEIPNNGLDDDGNGYTDDYYGYDLCNDDFKPMDDNGHGTHVAGTIAAATNNGIGISGIALTAKIMSLKGLSSGGSGTTDDLAECIYYATNNGADVQNYSWGGTGSSSVLNDAIQHAHSQGCVLVAAAGNSNAEVRLHYPGGLKEVITVAASDQNDVKCSFSNYGAKLDVCAPGGGNSGEYDPNYPWINILSLRARETDMYCSIFYPERCKIFIINGDYYRCRGTSMAAPHVAGLAALLLSTDASFPNEEIRQVIRLTADDVGDPGRDDFYGYGRINALNALDRHRIFINGEITSPGLYSYLDCGQPLTIKGYATGDAFYRYRLILKNKTTGEEEVLNESLNPVNSVSTLGEWQPQTSTHPEGEYEIKLEIENTTGIIIEDKIEVYLMACISGWPIHFNYYSNGDLLTPTIQDSPNIGDIDNDGYLEMVVVGNTHQLVPLNLKLVTVYRYDGTLHPGWPKIIGQEMPESIKTVLGDLDGDGKMEIVAATYKVITAWRENGEALTGWPKSIDIDPNNIILADLDNDDLLDVIVLSENKSIYAWKGNGEAVPGWPVSIYLGNSYAAVGDIDLDGANEIVIHSIYAGSHRICVLSNTGKIIHSWSIQLSDYRDSVKIVLGDLDNDGELEIIIGAQEERKVFAYKKDGTPLPGWPVNMIGRLGFVSLADVDNNGYLDVIAGTKDGYYAAKNEITVFDNHGNIRPGWPISLTYYNDYYGDGMIKDAVIGDIDSDGQLEIMTTAHYAINSDIKLLIHAWELNGTDCSGYPIEHPTWELSGYSSTISLVDLENDGKIDIVMPTAERGVIDVYRLDGNYNKNKMPWPTLRQNTRRTGVYNTRLHLTAPNGGQNLMLGEPYNITWAAADVNGNIKISLWRNNTQVGAIADNIDPAAGSYTWTVGQYNGGTAPIGAGYTIKVKAKSAMIFDSSDTSFRISSAGGPFINLTAPNGDENWKLGTTENITWTSLGVTGGIKITLWKDGVLLGLITDSVDPAAGSFAWNVGQYSGGAALAGTGYTVNIKEKGTTAADSSDACFTLSPVTTPTLTIDTPNGGEYWRIGDTETIGWAASGFSDKLKITLWNENILIGLIADDVDSAAGSYPWIVGQLSGGSFCGCFGSGYFIKIKAKNTAVTDVGNDYFTITDRLEDYYTESQIPHTFNGGGAAQNYHLDDGYITYTLPFDFPYFSVKIGVGSEVYISSNGFIHFPYSRSDLRDFSNSTSELIAATRIAPCWDDLRTDGSAQPGEDIYITENADNLVIRWAAETYDTAIPVNVEAVLYRDGRIQFNYGSGNTTLSPTIGISRGSRLNYYLSAYDSQTVLTNSDSVLFTPLPPSITVTAPNGGENWTIGADQNITWKTTGKVGLLKITLWKDGVQVGLVADGVDPVIGAYAWKVGQYSSGTAAAGSGYSIKIKEMDTSVADTSDAPFQLSQ